MQVIFSESRYPHLIRALSADGRTITIPKLLRYHFDLKSLNLRISVRKTDLEVTFNEPIL